MSSLPTVAISDIADVNPTTSISDLAVASFVGMEDVSESFALTRTSDRDVSSSRGYTRFREGDLLFAKITPCMENGKGAHVSGLTNGIGFGSTEFHILRARSAEPRFLAQWLQAKDLRLAAETQMTGSAGQRRVPTDFFLRYRIPSLPIPEQRRIADILETLDDQIRTTAQIIGKLKITGDGIINDLLTCGIDGHGELRRPIDNPELFTDTPIGLLPRDWNITSVGEAFDVQSGITLGPHRRPRKGSVRYLRVANVRRAALDLTELSRLQVSVAERHRYALRENDLLVVEGHGDVGQIGRCARVDSHAVGLLHQNHLFRLRSSALNAVLAEAWLNSDYAKSYWRRTCSTSSGLNTINSRQLKAMVVGLPSYSEQERIAAFLTAQQSRMDSERKMLAGLQSLKQGLMSDLLTGRVRVPPETAS